MCLKRLLLVFLTTMFMGCAAASQLIQIPKFSAAWQIDPGSGNVPSVKEVSQAMIVYYVHWERTFGDRNKKVKKALNGLMIEWSTKRRLVKANGWTTDGRRIKLTHGKEVMPIMKATNILVGLGSTQSL
jgi:hypothetical protein